MNNSTFNTKPEAQAVAEIVQANLEPVSIEIDLAEHGARFEGQKLKAIGHVDKNGAHHLHSLQPLLEERALRPARKKGTAQLETVSSFVDLSKRFKSQHSVMFASRRRHPELITVFDYNEAHDGQPAFGEHRARYAFPYSDAFKRWKAIDGKGLDQAKLAELIDERICDLIDPGPERSALNPTTQEQIKNLAVIADPSGMIQLAKGLEYTANYNVTNKVDTKSGRKELVFKESHNDAGGSPLSIPDAFVIQIQLFRNGGLYQLPVRMRYHIKNGAITWTLSLYLLEEILEHSFNNEARGAAGEAGIPLIFGLPEGSKLPSAPEDD